MFRQLTTSVIHRPFSTFRKPNFRKSSFVPSSLIISVFAASSIGFCFYNDRKLFLDSQPTAKRPIFTRQQVSEHTQKQTGIWVTYKNGVYDITEFVEGHPGGEKILMAAGRSIEPFWEVYTIHKSHEVLKILEQYRIGDIDPKDLAEDSKSVPIDIVNDPFANDPPRSPILSVRSQKPFNAETPLPILFDYFVTPVEIFYKRNHLPIPDIKPDDFTLEIGGIGIEKSVKLSLKELQKLPQTEVMATIQCAGNRRKDMAEKAPVMGLLWEGGAIGNAIWTGVKLTDLLKHLGISPQGEHVQLAGLDGYGASIPISKALDPKGDVLVALKMNGEDLIRDHGFPVRVIVPGHVAARSVKWCNKITFSNEESESHWQRNDYKMFQPSSDWDRLDWASAAAIQEMPVQSCIVEPQTNSTLKEDEVTVKGYAWSGGGRGILRVDVSVDGGNSWKVAELKRTEDQQKPNQAWAWTQWEITVPISAATNDENIEIICKATDSSHNCQPNDISGIYNKRGLLNNSWHKITLKRIYS